MRVEPEILKLLRDCPDMPATVVAERIGLGPLDPRTAGAPGRAAPAVRAPEPCRPGELAQFDLWQPDADIPLGHGQSAKCWVIVGVSGFSRFLGAWMIPSRQAHDVLGGYLKVLHQFGALPRMVVWDQEGAIGRDGRWPSPSSSRPSKGTLGIGAQLCQRGDPKAKGLVEPANGHLETSFLPGRRFEDLAEFNRQLTTNGRA